MASLTIESLPCELHQLRNDMNATAPEHIHRLPAVIGGVRRPCRRVDDIEFVSRTGARFAMPRFTTEDLDEVLRQDKQALAALPLQEILSFLNRAGKQWRSPEYPRRRLYIRQMKNILGHSERAAEAEADRIAILLNSHARMYDMIESDLGSRFVVDDWVAREDCFVRAFPRGLVVHILPGNVALSAAMSIVRNLITKNACVAKVASGDPLTATALAMTFADVDDTHPITRAMNVVYWEHDQEQGMELTHAADAVVAWGGNEAVRYARKHAHDEAAVTCFGPKHSLALVDTTFSVGDAARGLAHDVAVYDQQACFSVRRVFVRGPLDPFLDELRSELDRHAELLPPGHLSVDRAAQIQLGLRLEEFLGANVTPGAKLGWALVVGPPPTEPTDHQLGRVLHVHPVESLSEAYSFIDSSIQTVSAAPWSVLTEHRNELAQRGVSRMTELGLAHLFRIGGTHDGVNPLQGMVRMVSAEAPADVFGKGMVLRLDESTMLEAGTLKDFVL